MNILTNFFRNIYYRKHPEAALRYLPIVDFLKKHKLEESEILEVGSGSYGITPYLKRKIIGVDTDFSEPSYYLLEPVEGSAVNLPFIADQFDVVILSDVLEHIPPKLRNKAEFEAIRVAKVGVIFSGPFGEEASKQDKELADYSMKVRGNMHPFFKEHIEYGLPNLRDLISRLEKLKKVKKVTIIGKYFNLNWRKRLMRLFISKNKFIYYFYLKGMMPLIPLLRRLNKNPCYRTLIWVEVKK